MGGIIGTRKNQQNRQNQVFDQGAISAREELRVKETLRVFEEAMQTHNAAIPGTPRPFKDAIAQLEQLELTTRGNPQITSVRAKIWFILGNFYRAHSNERRAEAAYKKAEGLGHSAEEVQQAIAFLPHNIVALVPLVIPAQIEGLQIQQEDAISWANQVSECVKSGEDQGGILQGLQKLELKSCVSTIPNPLAILLILVPLLAEDSLLWETTELKTQIAKVAHQYAYAVYAKSVAHPLPEETKKKLIDPLKASLYHLNEKLRTENSLCFHLKCLLATIEIIPNDVKKIDTAIRHGTQLVRFAVGIYQSITSGPSEELQVASLYFAEVCYKTIRTAFIKKWYEKVLYIDYLACRSFTHLDDFQALKALLQANQTGDWKVLVAGIKALAKIVEENPSTNIQREASTEISSYLAFDKFRIQNNWRIRAAALEASLLLKDHKDPEVSAQIEENLVSCGTLETNPRVRLVLAQSYTLLGMKEKLQRGWERKKGHIEEAIEQQSLELQRLEALIRGIPIPEEKSEWNEKLEEQTTLLRAQLQNLTAFQSQIGEHISFLQGISDKLDAQLLLLRKLTGDPVEVILQMIQSDIKADERRQGEQKFYIENQTVTSWRRIHSQAIEELKPLREVYRAFLKSEKKVCVLEALAGSGKTMFLERLEEELLDHYNPCDPNAWIPLRIPLAALQNPVYAAIEEGLERRGFNSLQIQQLKGKKVLLMLDGVDEARYQGLPIQRTHHLYYTNKLYQWRQAKVIFGIRIGGASEITIEPKQFEPYDNDILSSYRPDLLQEIILCPFSPEKVRNYIAQYVVRAPNQWKQLYPDWILGRGEKYFQVLSQLEEEAKEMIERPFTLRILAETLPSIVQAITTEDSLDSRAKEITSIRMYEEFVNQWFDREERALVGTLIPLDIQEAGVKEYAWDYCMALACAMKEAKLTTIIYRAAHQQAEGMGIGQEWDKFFNVKYDTVRVCRRVAPLKRVGEAGFAFIHDFLMEFFVTKFVALEVKKMDAAPEKTPLAMQ